MTDIERARDSRSGLREPANSVGPNALREPANSAVPNGVVPSGVAPNVDVPALPFDKALAELQAVVARLEAGGLQLEESIALYERGVALHDHCSTLLTGAELRVQRLVEGAGGSLRTIDLRPDDET